MSRRPPGQSALGRLSAFCKEATCVAVLDPQTQHQVRRLRQTGKSLSLIAIELGLNVNTVKSWCRRNNIKPSATNGGPASMDRVATCLECTNPLVGRQTRFCSDPCRRAWWKAHPDQIQRAAYYAFACVYCGQRFKAYGNSNRKYCSHACYIRHRFATQGGRP